MQIEGAIIKEQGQTFAIVIVKPHILNSSSDCEEARDSFRRYFPGIPIILMAQDAHGKPTYHGRRDIVGFLANLHMSQIPWKKYTFN